MHAYVHCTVECYSAVKNNENLAIWDIGGPRGYYVKWNKSDRGRQIWYDITYMWNLKTKQMNKHKKTETES